MFQFSDFSFRQKSHSNYCEHKTYNINIYKLNQFDSANSHVPNALTSEQRLIFIRMDLFIFVERITRRVLFPSRRRRFSARVCRVFFFLPGFIYVRFILLLFFNRVPRPEVSRCNGMLREFYDRPESCMSVRSLQAVYRNVKALTRPWYRPAMILVRHRNSLFTPVFPIRSRSLDFMLGTSLNANTQILNAVITEVGTRPEFVCPGEQQRRTRERDMGWQQGWIGL